MKKLSLLPAASLACLSALSFLSPGFVHAAPAAAPPSAALMVRLSGHLTPAILSRSSLLGRQNSAERVPLALTLPLRDPAGLSRLLTRMYTPGDPQFHRFLSSDEFAARFGPSPQTYNAVIAFAKAGGLAVTQTYKSRTLLDVAGSSAAVEAAFHVRLFRYAEANGRIFHAPNAEPAVPAALAGTISGVVGLQNSAVAHSHRTEVLFPDLANEIGSGPDNGLTPNDIKAAYNLSTSTLTGKGRTLGLYELDAYDQSDVSSYENNYGLPQVPLLNIPVDGGVGTPGDGAGEVTLDIELMTALAPGAAQILVYEAPNDGGPGALDLFHRMADDNSAKEISSSWGSPEKFVDDPTRQSENSALMQMASQGQTFYVASGDSGAYDDGTQTSATISVDDPTTQPYATGVGGTTLNVQSAGGPYVSETTWNNPSDTQRSVNGAGSGGGVSTVWPLPSYQVGVSTLFSTSQRNVPDVALDADPDTGYSIYYGGSWTIFGGTSCAAPLWAAFTALVNQQRQANQQADLGFANPLIYKIAGGASYPTTFHDVADMSNNLYPAYTAGPGYDVTTGWGSFNGVNLIAQMAPAVVVGTSPVASLTLTPASVVGGISVQGTVTLSNPAPDSGAVVTLAAAPAGGPVAVPASVLVASGATTASFTAATSTVTASTPVTITASYSGGTATATLTVLPPPAVITPVSLVLDPTSVGGGASSTATVTLSGPAPAAGLSVTLKSSSASAGVPGTVAVAAGAASATFTVSTSAVAAQTVSTISAALNGTTQSADLTILAPALKPVKINPATVIGGDSTSETLTLTLPALPGGASLTLTSDSPSAVVPATAMIPAGQTQISVPVTTSAVSVTTAVNLTAEYGGVTQKVVLTIKATPLNGLSLAPATVIGGSASVGTISLGAPAPAAGLTATLTSSDPSVLIPASVTIPPNATSAAFPLPTVNVAALVKATLTVSLGAVKQTATLTIQPVQITALSLAPASVVTGTATVAKITLNAPAPAGGLVVTLSSSTAAAAVPATMLIPEKTATATFPVASPHAGSAVISALLAGVSQKATLTVNGAPGTTFPAGLNLISAPYDYTGMALDSLFGTPGTVVATYMPETAGYVFAATAPADTLHLGRGYWINLPAAVTLSTVGTPADPSRDFSIALAPGWNEIGQPWTTAQPLSSLSVTGGGATVPFDQAASGTPLLVSSLVYRYQPKSGTTPGGYIWVRDTDTLQPGLGYWIYAYQSVTLTVPRH